MQADKERDDAKKLAEKNKHKQCFDCQKQGHVKRDCRNHERDIKKAKESGASFVDRKQTAENHGR